MSDLCHICGPVKHDAPTVICAPCSLSELGRVHESRLLRELLVLRILRDEVVKLSIQLGSLGPGALRTRMDLLVELASGARPA
jgi:hypothetical protein